jgi:iron complex transport system permease protein
VTSVGTGIGRRRRSTGGTGVGLSSAVPAPAAGPEIVVLPTSRLRPGALLTALVVALAACAVGFCVGPASLPVGSILGAVTSHLPLLGVHSSLGPSGSAILWDIRAPRVVLGFLVGGTLAISGAAYQGTFRNPLGDPYLLGVAAGAGLGATVVIVADHGDATSGLVAPVAFAGAFGAVALAWVVAAGGTRRGPSSLILAGVAVASILTAVQTFLQQRQAPNTINTTYEWLLGSLATAQWGDVWHVLPYCVVCVAVIVAHGRLLDTLSVGDLEAASMGVPVARVRLAVVGAASLGAAAVVSVSGLIGFVGIIVPHTVRLLTGTSYRVICPLSFLGGGAFLVLADVAARSLLSPSEIPIGVVTAVIGGPFFILVLRRRQLLGL